MGMNNRLLRPRASGFNPRSISGLVYWWDASDLSTLTPSTGVGPFSEWRSKATAATVASQATANNQPTNTTINGRNAVLFDGSNDGFDFTGTARTDETWIIAAAQLADQTGTRTLVNDGTSGHGINISRGSVRLLDTSWGDNTEGSARLRVQYAANPATPYGPAVVSVVRSAAAGGFVYIDGTQRSSAVNGATSFTTSGSVTIAKIGYYNSSTFTLNGWIGEILCWSKALSATERSAAEKYLGKKWGITVA